MPKLLPVQFSRSVVPDSLRPHGLQHTRTPCPSPTPGACSNSCPLSHPGHPTISSPVIPFSSCLQSFPASGSSPMSQFFTSGGQSIGVSASASFLPMNIQDCFPLGLTSSISLQSKGLLKSLQMVTAAFLLGRKAMTNLDSILKSRDITLPTKVRLVMLHLPEASITCNLKP